MNNINVNDFVSIREYKKYKTAYGVVVDYDLKLGYIINVILKNELEIKSYNKCGKGELYFIYSPIYIVELIYDKHLIEKLKKLMVFNNG